MNLDDLIRELERLRREHGGDTEVAVTVNGRAYLKNEDDSWPTVIVSYEDDEGVIAIDTMLE